MWLTMISLLRVHEHSKVLLKAFLVVVVVTS